MSVGFCRSARNGPSPRFAGTTLRAVKALVWSFVMISMVAGAAPKKKVVKPPPPKSAATIATEVAVKKTLYGAEAQVGGCVLENAGPAAFTLVVKAQLTLNSAGQLMGTTLSMTPEWPTGEKLKKCVDGVLKGLTWPKSTGPIVNAEREWTFSTESK